MGKVTKETLKRIVDLWNEGKPVEVIATEVGLSPVYVRSLVYQMRKAGIPLAKRVERAGLKHMIQELAREYQAA